MISTRLLRPMAAVLFAGLGVLPLAVSRAGALNIQEARHLLARTGFGNATWREIERLRPLSRKQAVELLLRETRKSPSLAPPAWTRRDRALRPPRGAGREERRAFRRARRKEALTLVDWWVREMASTSSPLTERMTLFWHNHFTSSFRKVRAPQLLYRQNLTLRRYALDNFRVLTHAMAQDAAMVVYLDNFRNRRGKPNENFARELLELFTLGEGHYSERDIKEAARSFTGWAIDRQTGAFRFFRRRHDGGMKTFMGRRGRFNGDQVIEIVLSRPQVALHITRKAWRAFVSEAPDAKQTAAIARRFRQSGYDIKTLMRGLLLSQAFWAAESRGRLIKSPIDLIVGTVRQFNVAPPGGRLLFRIARALGQVPFMPPNVKGWPGGKRWISAHTLLMRRQVLQALVRGQTRGQIRGQIRGQTRGQIRGQTREQTRGGEIAPNGMGPGRPAAKTRKRQRNMTGMGGGRMQAIDIDGWMRQGDPAYRNAAAVTGILLPVPPVSRPGRAADPVRFVRALLLDPAYQLK